MFYTPALTQDENTRTTYEQMLQIFKEQADRATSVEPSAGPAPMPADSY